MRNELGGSSCGNVTLTRSACILGLLCVGVLASGCHRPSERSDAGDIHGVYTLVSVDGATVPARVIHDRVSLEVRSGSMTFHGDGTCTSKTTFVPPSGAETHREVVASYTRNGSELKMTWKGAGRTVGTMEGDQFTMNNEGMIFAYKR